VKESSLAARIAIFIFVALTFAIPPAVMSQKPSPQSVADGRRLFNQSCTACHDTLGTTTKSGPGLKNYYRHQPRPADASVRTVIQQGKGRMPAFNSLSKSQIDELVVYLKSL
jgi:mono/diheme cytochrome c family protein